MCQSLVKIQIGPVQDFIAAARSTRDLWSGSYLLSWLVAAGIRALPEGAKLIFPNPEGQPLLKKDPSDQTDLLIPNLPNLFIAQVAGDPASAAKAVKVAIEKEWQTIAGAVWEQRAHFDLPDSGNWGSGTGGQAAFSCKNALNDGVTGLDRRKPQNTERCERELSTSSLQGRGLNGIPGDNSGICENERKCSLTPSPTSPPSRRGSARKC